MIIKENQFILESLRNFLLHRENLGGFGEKYITSLDWPKIISTFRANPMRPLKNVYKNNGFSSEIPEAHLKGNKST